MDRISQDRHALALIAALTAPGLTVGDHRKPDGASPPYTVFYMLPGGEVDGSLETPDADGDLRFQLTHVGRLPAEARWEADRASTALLSAAVTVAGRSIDRVRPLEASNQVQRDDDIDPPLFYLVARYGAWTTPA